MKDGDTGFAACYKWWTGSLVDYAWTSFQYDDPQWVFLGEVKATNKGTAVKSTGDGGWLESYTWNKHALNMYDLCGFDSDITSDVYYMYAYHDSNINYEYDYVGIVSEDGFKNTGLHNGENHLKCWF